MVTATSFLKENIPPSPNTVKAAHAVTSIKQSPVLNGNNFLVLS